MKVLEFHRVNIYRLFSVVFVAVQYVLCTCYDADEHWVLYGKLNADHGHFRQINFDRPPYGGLHWLLQLRPQLHLSAVTYALGRQWAPASTSYILSLLYRETI